MLRRLPRSAGRLLGLALRGTDLTSRIEMRESVLISHVSIDSVLEMAFTETTH